MGRQRKYANDAARQQAFRDRHRTQHPESETARLIALQEREVHGPTGGNVRRDATDTLGNDIHCLFSILHWQYREKTPVKADSTPAKCPNNAGS